MVIVISLLFYCYCCYCYYYYHHNYYHFHHYTNDNSTNIIDIVNIINNVIIIIMIIIITSINIIVIITLSSRFITFDCYDKHRCIFYYWFSLEVILKCQKEVTVVHSGDLRSGAAHRTWGRSIATGLGRKPVGVAIVLKCGDLRSGAPRTILSYPILGDIVHYPHRFSAGGSLLFMRCVSLTLTGLISAWRWGKHPRQFWLSPLQIVSLSFVWGSADQDIGKFVEFWKVRKLPRDTTNVQKNKSYVGLFISYVGLIKSYVGL